MHRRIAWGIALAALTCVDAATAQLLCGGPDVPKSPSRAPVAPEALVGSYRCAEEGMTITLRLDADGRFEQRLQADAGTYSEIERADLESAGKTGRWRIEGDRLYLFNKPTRPPVLQLVESKRDPSVWMRVEVRDAQGRPATGLFVGDGPDANPRSALEDGVVTVPRDYSWEPGVRQVVRTGDELSLASFTPAENGANMFRYVYRPSDVEPFEIRGSVIDARRGIVAVPLGIGGAALRRVTPKK